MVAYLPQPKLGETFSSKVADMLPPPVEGNQRQTGISPI